MGCHVREPLEVGVGAGELLGMAQEVTLSSPLLGDQGGDRQRHDRCDSEEGLEEQQGVVLDPPREGAQTTQQARDRDPREREARRGGLPLAEAEGGPEQEGDAQERQGEVCGTIAREAPEDGVAHAQDQQKQEAGLQSLLAAQLDRALPAPQDQERRDDEITPEVSQPPGEPDGAQAAPAREAPAQEARDSQRGTDRRARHRGQNDVLEHVPRTIEGTDSAREPVHEIRARQAFERVADRDPDRRPGPTGRDHVHQESSEEHSRPCCVATEQECGQGDSGRRPYRRRAWIDEGEHQAELPRREIDQRQGHEDHGIDTGLRLAHRCRSRRGRVRW